MTVSPRGLQVRGRLYAPTHPGATALVGQGRSDRVRRGRRRCPALERRSNSEVDLQGRLVAAAFVDATSSAVQTGLVAVGLDLHDAATVPRCSTRFAVRGSAARWVIVGQGWDGGPGPIPGRRPAGAGPGGRWPAGLPGWVDVTARGRLSTRSWTQAARRFQNGRLRRGPGVLTKEAHPPPPPPGQRPCSRRRRPEACGPAALRQAVSLGVGGVHELGGSHLPGPMRTWFRFGTSVPSWSARGRPTGVN